MRLKKLATLFLSLICALALVSPMLTQHVNAQNSIAKWYQILYMNQNYDVFVSSTSPLSNLFKRPLSSATDAGFITNIYATDSAGNGVTDLNLVKQLVLDSQNDALFTRVQDSLYQSAIQLPLQEDVRADSERSGVSYTVYVPTGFSDLWKSLFLYSGTDAYSERVEMWCNVIIDAILQSESYEHLDDDRSKMNDMQTILESVETGGQAGGIVGDMIHTILYGTANTVLLKDQVSSVLVAIQNNEEILIRNAGPLDKMFDKEVLDNVGLLSDCFGVASSSFSLYNDAMRFYLKTTLANARAEFRLSQLSAFLQANSANVDLALMDGLTEATTKFAQLKNGYNGNTNDLFTTFAGPVLNLIYSVEYLVADLADLFAGTPILGLVKAFYQGYEDVMYIINGMDLVQSACLAATLQNLISGNVPQVSGLPSYKNTISTSDYPDDSLTSKSLELMNMDHYLAYLFHEKMAQVMDPDSLWVLLGDIIWGAFGWTTPSQAIEFNLNAAATELDYTLETACPFYLTGFTNQGGDDHSWLLDKAGVIPALRISVSTDNSLYSPNGQVALTAFLTDQSSAPVSSASVSYVVEDTSGTIVQSGGPLSDNGNGNYGVSFSAPPTPLTYQIVVSGTKIGYLSITSSVSMIVQRLAQGHNVRLFTMSANNLYPPAGGSVTVSGQTDNIGLYTETVTANIAVNGPSYTFTTSVPIGTLQPGHSTGNQPIYTWAVPQNAQNGYYTITVTVQGAVGDEDPSDNSKSVSVYVGSGVTPTHSAYSYVELQMTYDDNLDLRSYGALWVGGYGPVQYGNYEIALWYVEGPDGDTNVQTPFLSARFTMVVWLSGTVIVNCQNPRRLALYTYFDNNNVIFNIYMRGYPYMWVKVGVPSAAATLVPTQQSCQVTKQARYHVNVPPQSYPQYAPQVMPTDGQAQPIITFTPITWFQVPSSATSSFDITANPQTSGTTYFAVDTNGVEPSQGTGYIVFGQLTALDIYDSAISSLSVNPPSPQSGNIVSITTVVVDRGTAALTGTTLNTIVTGPYNYLQSFSATIGAGTTTFTWNTNELYGGTYAINSTILNGMDSDGSNNFMSISVPLLPPPPPPDTTPPETSVNASRIVSLNGTITFSWSGRDDVTPNGNLVYSYFLLGRDSSWSPWVSDRTKTYNGLQDGSYTFQVKAKDQAGNEDPTPDGCSFVVDTTHPTVLDSNVTGTDIPIENLVLEVTFSESMNHALTQSAFSINPSTPGSFTWNNDTLIFKASSDLVYGTTYAVTIGSLAADTAGNPITSPISWQFVAQRACIQGDLNGDAKVDNLDLIKLARAYGSNTYEPNWNPNCDINSNNLTDVFDLFLLGKNYGSSVQKEPIGYWKLDEGSSNVAYDSSGNHNDGTINGASWTTGISNGALQFDGVDDYVGIPSSPSLALTGNQASVEMWIKPTVTLDSSLAHRINILDKGDAYGFQMEANDARINFFVRIGGANQWLSSTTNSWTAGAWYHIVGTHNGTNESIYVNGALENTKPLSGNLSGTGLPLSIGSYCYGTMDFFNGIIDEVKIYDYARTAQEIMDDYMSITTPQTTRLNINIFDESGFPPASVNGANRLAGIPISIYALNDTLVASGQSNSSGTASFNLTEGTYRIIYGSASAGNFGVASKIVDVSGVSMSIELYCFQATYHVYLGGGPFELNYIDLDTNSAGYQDSITVQPGQQINAEFSWWELETVNSPYWYVSAFGSWSPTSALGNLANGCASPWSHSLYTVPLTFTAPTTPGAYQVRLVGVLDYTWPNSFYTAAHYQPSLGRDTGISIISHVLDGPYGVATIIVQSG